MTELLALTIGTSAVVGAFTLGYVWATLLAGRRGRDDENSRK